MKAILEFELPLEREGHRDALKGTYYKCEIQAFDNYLRSATKYGLPEELKTLKITEDVIEDVLMLVREKLFELCAESLND